MKKLPSNLFSLLCIGVALGASRPALAEAPPDYITHWGMQGVASADTGKFDNPLGIAIDSHGNVYVVDSGNSRIQKFDNNGKFIAMWGSYGEGPGQFRAPWGIALDHDDNVYVSEQFSNPYQHAYIQKFTSSGGFITRWGVVAPATGPLALPIHMTVDQHNQLYVADAGKRAVAEFESDSTLIQEWGYDSIHGWSPYGVAVDDSDQVYVSGYAGTITKFENDGTFLCTIATQGQGTGYVSQPTDLAMNSNNDLYVADRHNYRIQKFSRDGTFLTQWGQQGSGDGSFENTEALAVDHSGNIFVVDLNRIQKFGHATTAVGPSAGSPLLQLAASPNPSAGKTTLQFTLPRSSDVSLGVYDVSGRQVAAWHWDQASAGPHELEWDGYGDNGRHAGTCVLFLRLSASGQTRTRKFVRLR